MYSRGRRVNYPAYRYDPNDFPPLGAMPDIGDPNEPTHSISSSDGGSADTPTHTTRPDSNMHERCASPSYKSFTINGMCEVPEPGWIYMIRDIDSEKAITLLEGRLTLEFPSGTRGGWQWTCEELPDGWIGFREVVSGRFLGRDNRGGFYAQATKLKAWESFVLRPRELGGYNLCVKNWSALTAIAVSNLISLSPKLVEASTADDAARWEFVKVEVE
ncbi:hypothetical protein F5Y09DRAFT_317978 [Xylaria sp. FL1042]|nr:hypothetical protein F5Y09DRAFT_317978 [Xylaria sp. FL1042]